MFTLLCNTYPEQYAGPIASRTRAKLSPDGSRMLRNVAAWVLGATVDQEAAICEILRAFGGSTADSMEAATHAIVPAGLTKDEFERLRQQIRYFHDKSVSVVSAEWLEFVSGNVGSNPFDKALLLRFMPQFVHDLIVCETPKVRESKRRRLIRKTGVASPSDSRRTAGAVAPAASSRKFLTGSLQETLDFLRREHPEEVEKGHLRLAIERSLLDCAVTLHSMPRDASMVEPAIGKVPQEAPEDVLGVASDASAAEVRAAYREKARATHPDRGGDSASFCRVRRAYLALLHKRPMEAAPAPEGDEAQSSPEVAGVAALLPLPAGGDFELRDHRALVAACFERHGVDLSQHVARQLAALSALGLQECEAGSVNRNERGEEMINQCFYLSLARSYSGARRPQRKEMEELALVLKRVVEAAVLSAHPDWGGSRVGEEVQAFSDFLFFTLGSNTLLSELCIAVFDSVSGSVEIFKGKHYPGPEKEAEHRSNMLTIKHVPGHYQALLPATKASRPMLLELQQCLDEHGVLYVITDG